MIALVGRSQDVFKSTRRWETQSGF